MKKSLAGHLDCLLNETLFPWSEHVTGRAVMVIRMLIARYRVLTGREAVCDPTMTTNIFARSAHRRIFLSGEFVGLIVVLQVVAWVAGCSGDSRRVESQRTRQMQPLRKGQLVRVVDGDTVDLSIDGRKIRVRLFGVDAPEGGQPFGHESARLLTSLLSSGMVMVDPVAIDRYGRTVAWVFLSGSEVSANEEMVGAGAGWWFRKYAPREKRLAQLEKRARMLHRGLWRCPGSVAPWEWRKAKRKRNRRAP